MAPIWMVEAKRITATVGAAGTMGARHHMDEVDFSGRLFPQVSFVGYLGTGARLGAMGFSTKL
jgi:hypothetical protein